MLLSTWQNRKCREANSTVSTAALTRLLRLAPLFLKTNSSRKEDPNYYHGALLRYLSQLRSVITVFKKHPFITIKAPIKRGSP